MKLTQFLAIATALACATVGAPNSSASPNSPESRPLYTWSKSVSAPMRYLVDTFSGIKIDSANRAYFAYGGEALYYAVADGDAVTVTNLITMAIGPASISLALDANQSPAIRFISDGQLKIARLVSTTWQISAVPGRAFDYDYGYTMLVVGDDNRARVVSHGVPPTSSLSIDIETTSGWSTIPLSYSVPMTIAGNPDFRCWPAFTGIVLDSQQQPHVGSGGACTASGVADEVPYAVEAARNNGVWSVNSRLADSPVGISIDSANSVRLISFDSFGQRGIVAAADDNDKHAHVVTLVYSPTTTLYYLAYAGCVSCTQTAPAAIGTIEAVDLSLKPRSVALAVDMAGMPRATYINAQQEVVYARWTGSQWKKIVIDSASDAIGVNKQLVSAIDASDQPIVAFIDGARRLRVAQHISDTWQIEHLANDAQNVVITSDSIGAGVGTPELAYTAGSNLVHAKLSSSGWITDVIVNMGADTSGLVGIALDNNDGAHVAVYRQFGLIEHYRQSGGAWLPQTISVPSGSIMFSLMRDPAGRIIIAYADSSVLHHLFDYPIATSLVFKAWTATGNQWVDAGQTCRAGVETRAIALDNSGWPRVLHRQPDTNGACSFSRWTGSAWVTLPTTTECESVAVAIGPANVTTFVARALYGDLVFAQRLGIDFNYEKVATTTGVFQLGINRKGQPVIVSVAPTGGLGEDGALALYTGTPCSFALLPQIMR